MGLIRIGCSVTSPAKGEGKESGVAGGPQVGASACLCSWEDAHIVWRRRRLHKAPSQTPCLFDPSTPD